MNDFVLKTKDIKRITGYSQSTIRSKTTLLVSIYPLFAIKNEFKEWVYDERALAVFILIKNGQYPEESYSSVIEFAIEAIYHCKVTNISLDI